MCDAPALGGGRLGPDLTNVYERLKGRAALSAWLMAPGTETMQPIFKNHPLSAEEIHALVAYFESTTAEPSGGFLHGASDFSVVRIGRGDRWRVLSRRHVEEPLPIGAPVACRGEYVSR